MSMLDIVLKYSNCIAHRQNMQFDLMARDDHSRNTMVNRKNVKETDGQNGHTVTQIHNRETRTDAGVFGDRCDLFDANDYRSQPENHQHNYSKTNTH